MAFKRALWSSGYTYKMRCPYCGTNNQYTDKALDFRMWYPNGFILCARCRKPLRHNEIFAVDKDGNPVFNSQAEADASVETGYLNSVGYPAAAQNQHVAQNADVVNTPDAAQTVVQEPVPSEAGAAPETAEETAPKDEGAEADYRFCNKCGRKYRKGIDLFCSGCGNKLPSE
ncbi:MAG: hypothetical protein IKX06_02540 [Clostridia bacterium]|nr:hypothetical protein [Clostridia bacterium]